MYKFKDFIYRAIINWFEDLEKNQTLMVTLKYCNDFILKPKHKIFNSLNEFTIFLESPEEKEVYYIVGLEEEYFKSNECNKYNDKNLMDGYKIFLQEMLQEEQITVEERKEITNILEDMQK